MKSQLSRPLSLFARMPAGGSFQRAWVFFSAFLFCASLAGNAQKVDVDSGLIAHEWGTFTSIAGETGQAVEWLPLNSPSELPNFVEHFRGTGFKVGLGGTIRMETPVLYFLFHPQYSGGRQLFFSSRINHRMVPVRDAC